MKKLNVQASVEKLKKYADLVDFMYVEDKKEGLYFMNSNMVYQSLRITEDKALVEMGYGSQYSWDAWIIPLNDSDNYVYTGTIKGIRHFPNWLVFD